MNVTCGVAEHLVLADRNTSVPHSRYMHARVKDPTTVAYNTLLPQFPTMLLVWGLLQFILGSTTLSSLAPPPPGKQPNRLAGELPFGKLE